MPYEEGYACVLFSHGEKPRYCTHRYSDETGEGAAWEEEKFYEIIKKKYIEEGKYLCPFHDEKTPSFIVKRGKYKCFGCGASGEVEGLIKNNIIPEEGK
jgi:hypothetical protein